MKREHRKLTPAEQALITSRRPVVRRVKRPDSFVEWETTVFSAACQIGSGGTA